MVRSNSPGAARGKPKAPHRKIARQLPTSQNKPADWPLDADDEDESNPDDDFDDSPLDDFDFELDDEPDPEPGDFWGDPDDGEDF